MAEEVAATVRGLGRRAVVVGANLEAPEEIARLFDEVGARFGALDIFVANHAATAFKPTLEVKPHHLQRTFDLIVRSLVLCVQRAVPLMKGREGAIVTIGGQGTVECLPNYALLAAAKGAMETWTRYLAYELARDGITANCVSPGVILTDSSRFYGGDRFAEFDRLVSDYTPRGRMGTPEDVAAVVAFLRAPADRGRRGRGGGPRDRRGPGRLGVRRGRRVRGDGTRVPLPARPAGWVGKVSGVDRVHGDGRAGCGDQTRVVPPDPRRAGHRCDAGQSRVPHDPGSVRREDAPGRPRPPAGRGADPRQPGGCPGQRRHPGRRPHGRALRQGGAQNVPFGRADPAPRAAADLRARRPDPAPARHRGRRGSVGRALHGVRSRLPGGPHARPGVPERRPRRPGLARVPRALRVRERSGLPAGARQRADAGGAAESVAVRRESCRSTASTS